MLSRFDGNQLLNILMYFYGCNFFQLKENLKELLRLVQARNEDMTSLSKADNDLKTAVAEADCKIVRTTLSFSICPSALYLSVLQPPSSSFSSAQPLPPLQICCLVLIAFLSITISTYFVVLFSGASAGTNCKGEKGFEQPRR